MSGHTWFLFRLLPLLALTAVIFGYIGWWLRNKSGKWGATIQELEAERAKTGPLEERARKAEAERKAALSELEKIKAAPADNSAIESVKAALAEEKTRTDNLTVQLKKARESSAAAEARSSEAGKAAQAKAFELENQLARLREEAARATQEAVDARASLDRVKATDSTAANEIKALENQMLGLRTATAKAEKAADEVKAARDAAIADLTAARARITQLEEENAQARQRAGAAASAAAAPVAALAAAAPAPQPRGISEEQFNAVRSALTNAQNERDAAVRAKASAEAEAEELRSKADALATELAQQQQAASSAGEADTLRKALAEAEAAQSASSNEAGALRNQLVEARTRIAELEAAHALTAAAAAAPTIAASAPETTPAIVADVTASTSAAAEQPVQIEALTKEVAELRADRDSLHDQLSLLKKNLDTAVAFRSGEMQPDDLKEIKGVADVLNARLNAYGVFTFRQVAQWTDAEVDSFGLLMGFRDRVRREDWRGQCREFHKAKYGEDIA